MPPTKESTLYLPKQLDVLKKTSVAVLVSGGIESASLICLLKEYFANIYPIYIRSGLAWENTEQQFLLKYLEAVKQPGIESLKILSLPVNSFYGNHWSITGKEVPGANAEHTADYLPGRNLLFLTEIGIWCSLNQIHYIAVGSLKTNPFPDASLEFFEQMQNVLSLGLNFNINVLCPFAKMEKHEVIRLAKDLPLHLTVSCINPSLSHCGKCIKCAERKQGFLQANIEDQTIYD